MISCKNGDQHGSYLFEAVRRERICAEETSIDNLAAVRLSEGKTVARDSVTEATRRLAGTSSSSESSCGVHSIVCTCFGFGGDSSDPEGSRQRILLSISIYTANDLPVRDMASVEVYRGGTKVRRLARRCRCDTASGTDCTMFKGSTRSNAPKGTLAENWLRDAMGIRLAKKGMVNIWRIMSDSARV